MSEKIENVIICGTGPAGYTAALYTARANLEPLVFEGLQPGGQLTITTDVENYPGFEEGIMGPELMEVMRKQVSRFGTRFIMDTIVECKLDVHPFELTDSSGRVHKTKALIIATGASARYLGLENETRLQGYGVSACATCDGFFYRDLEICGCWWWRFSMRRGHLSHQICEYSAYARTTRSIPCIKDYAGSGFRQQENQDPLEYRGDRCSQEKTVLQAYVFLTTRRIQHPICPLAVYF